MNICRASGGLSSGTMWPAPLKKATKVNYYYLYIHITHPYRNDTHLRLKLSDGISDKTSDETSDGISYELIVGD